jgi:hypothetical protein
MQRQYLAWRVAIGLLAPALVALAGGCDDITAGQLMEDSAPPKLLKLIVQDETARSGRYIATDILDVAPGAACSVDSPCTASALGYPNPDCQIPDGMTTGICPDQLSGSCATSNLGEFDLIGEGPPYDSCGTATDGPRPVYLGTPIVGGGNAIRLVFSKLLDPSIEMVMADPMTGAYTYALPAGAIELDGPDGKPLALIPNDPATGGGLFYDAGGSPDTTSDPTVVPFGPAIVMKPAAPLAPNASYTVKITDPSKFVDHAKQQVSNWMSPYSFKTEQLTVIAAFPDITVDMATVLPDDVIQLTTNSDVVLDPANFTLGCGGTPVKLLVWKDQGADPTMCMDTPSLIDIVAVDAGGTPVDLPDGMVCTLKIDGMKDNSLGLSTFAGSYKFTVKGPKDPTDGSSVTNYILPADCMMAAPPDGGATD